MATQSSGKERRSAREECGDFGVGRIFTEYSSPCIAEQFGGCVSDAGLTGEATAPSRIWRLLQQQADPGRRRRSYGMLGEFAFDALIDCCANELGGDADSVHDGAVVG